MFIIMKHNSPDHNISERCRTKTFSGFDRSYENTETVVNFVLGNLCTIIILISIAKAIAETNELYENTSVFALTKSALRLQKYTIEFFTTLILAVFGFLTIFHSLNKKYTIVFRFSDITKVLKINSKVLAIAIYYFISIICVALFYTSFYNVFIIENIDNYLIKIQLFSFTLFLGCIVILAFRIIILFLLFFKYFFSNKIQEKQLVRLYLKVNDTNVINNVKILNFTEIKDSLNFLLEKNLKLGKTDNIQINSVNFYKVYDDLDIKIKFKIFLKVYWWAIIINFTIILMFQKLIITSTSSTTIILLAMTVILVNILECTIVFKTSIKELFIHAVMWLWGLSIKQEDQKVFYCSTLKNNITNRKYDDYFRNLYSTICLFRLTLANDEKISLEYLNEIYKFSLEYNRYLLYAICLYFYFEKYEKCNSNKKYIIYLNKLIDTQQINTTVSYMNVCEILKDVYPNYNNKILNMMFIRNHVIKIHTK